MDPNSLSAPTLISSLEAMIQASVTSILDRPLGPAAGEILDAQIQTAVAAALDRRLGPAVGSLGNRMTSLVEQRLADAVGILNFRVGTAVTAAIEERFGPVGGALTAQITFAAAPVTDLPSVASRKAQASGVVGEGKENNWICAAEEELGKAELASTENKQPTQERAEENGGLSEEEKGPAQNQSAAKQSLDTGPTGKEQPAQNQNATGTSPEPGDELSPPTATSAQSKESTSKNTAATQSDASTSAVCSLFADGSSKSKASPSATANRNAKTIAPSSDADKTPGKRKGKRKGRANKADDTEESESSSSEEEESDNEKPRRKRAKVKLDPPGYTAGPSLQFRRVSPKLTACAKSRGYPRVIDLRGFTEASNKQNLTMADVVATVLFNYDPLSLYAFMDMDQYPTFHFIRKESDRKAKNFVIERRRESYGVVVKVCGH